MKTKKKIGNGGPEGRSCSPKWQTKTHLKFSQQAIHKPMKIYFHRAKSFNSHHNKIINTVIILQGRNAFRNIYSHYRNESLKMKNDNYSFFHFKYKYKLLFVIDWKIVKHSNLLSARKKSCIEDKKQKHNKKKLNQRQIT